MLLKGVWVEGEQITNDQIVTKYVEKNQMYVEIVQARHFLEIKNSNAKNHTGLGGSIGVLLIALTQGPYS